MFFVWRAQKTFLRYRSLKTHTCRFISVDPLAAKYAQLTPYNYADNNLINDFDIDGMQDNNSEKSENSKPAVSGSNTDQKGKEEIKTRPGSEAGVKRTTRSRDYFNNMTSISGDSGFDGRNDWVSKTAENGETVVFSKERDSPDVLPIYYGFDKSIINEINESKPEPTNTVKTAGDDSSRSTKEIKPEKKVLEKEEPKDIEKNINVSGGLAIWSSFEPGVKTSGKDHHGKDAPMGAIVSQNFEDALNSLAHELIKNKIKKISLELIWTREGIAQYIIVEQSLKNGLQNIESYLKSFEKLSDLDINSSCKIPESNGGIRSNNLKVKYFKK